MLPSVTLSGNVAAGSEPPPLSKRTRQVERRARPPHTEALFGPLKALHKGGGCEALEF
jgi:hypothetical protein